MATPVAPTAVADTATTPQGVAVTVNPKANDTPGTDAVPVAVPLTSATVRFKASGQPAGVSGTTTSVTKAATGTWTVNTTTNEVTFTPDAAFTGAAPAIIYVLTDSQPLTSESTITVTVNPVTSLAAKRVRGPAAHVKTGKTVDLALTADFPSGSIIAKDALGFNRVTEAWVKFPVTSTVKGPKVPSTVPSGSVVRLIGS